MSETNLLYHHLHSNDLITRPSSAHSQLTLVIQLGAGT